MFVLEDIGNLLEREGIGIQGEDIFLGITRDEPENQVTVVPTGGYILNPNIKINRDTFQFLVRDVSFNQGYVKIYNIFNLFSAEDLIVTVEGRKMLIKPIQPPFSLGLDENNRSQFAFNIEVITDK